ncbi:MAG: diguanylate cyclase, partial [Clostridia bacterium]|nr:diguanylate cyclase [Clostridia bacterium]
MAGDRLLSTVSAHLSASFGEADVFRIGGDEFVVILKNEDSTNCDALMTRCIEGMKNLSLEGYPECRVS